jgi:TldD protein
VRLAGLAAGGHGAPVFGKGTAVAVAPTVDAVAGLVAEAVAAAASQVAHRAESRRPPPRGGTTVVFGPGAIGTVLHEACGHSLEGDALAEGSSLLAGAFGRPVGSIACTLIDDPTLPGCWGSFAFDDEGAEAVPITLLDHGVVRGAMHSSRSAAALGVADHSSGRAESYRVAPRPRMSNTYLAAGPHRPADVLAATDEGLYCGRVGAGSVEPSTGEFLFRAEELWSIRAGKLCEPLQDGVIVGRSDEALASVDLVADDVTLGPGRCGKDNQYVPVAQGGPTARLTGLGVRPA